MSPAISPRHAGIFDSQHSAHGTPGSMTFSPRNVPGWRLAVLWAWLEFVLFPVRSALSALLFIKVFLRRFSLTSFHLTVSSYSSLSPSCSVALDFGVGFLAFPIPGFLRANSASPCLRGVLLLLVAALPRCVDQR